MAEVVGLDACAEHHRLVDDPLRRRDVAHEHVRGPAHAGAAARAVAG